MNFITIKSARQQRASLRSAAVRWMLQFVLAVAVVWLALALFGLTFFAYKWGLG